MGTWEMVPSGRGNLGGKKWKGNRFLPEVWLSLGVAGHGDGVEWGAELRRHGWMCAEGRGRPSGT